MISDSSFVSAYVSIQIMKSESRSSTCLEINVVLGFCFENVSKQSFSFVMKTLEKINFKSGELLCKLSSSVLKLVKSKLRLVYRNVYISRLNNKPKKLLPSRIVLLYSVRIVLLYHSFF